MGIQLPEAASGLTPTPPSGCAWPWGVFDLSKVLISAKAGAAPCWFWGEPLLPAQTQPLILSRQSQPL